MKKFLLVWFLSMLAIGSAWAQSQSEEDRLWDLANSDTRYTEMPPEDRVKVLQLRYVSRADFDFKKQLLLSQTNSAMSQQVEELFKNSDNMSDEEFEAQIDKLAAQVPDFREKQQEYQAAKKAEQERKEREWQEQLRKWDMENAPSVPEQTTSVTSVLGDDAGSMPQQIDSPITRSTNTATNTSSKLPTDTSKTPTSNQTAPTDTQTAPTDTQTAPTDTQTAPTDTQTAPMSNQTETTSTQTVPTSTQTMATDTQTTPTSMQTTPTSTQTTPTDTQTTPTATQTAPTDTQTAPTDTQTTPTATQTTPTATQTAPTDTQTAPTDTQTALTDTQTMATDTQTTPTSTQTTPTSTQTTPTSTQTTPTSTQTVSSTSLLPNGALSTNDVLGKSKTLDNMGNIVFGYDVQNGADNLNTENANANSSTEAQASIAGCSGDVFQQIQCKVLQFLSDLRVLVYVLAGFGLIMFAYAAIFNKVNMKHLASIGMGLFLLAMMGPFIEYFSGNSMVTTALGYGNFIGDEYTYVKGSGAQAAVDQNQIPDTSVANNNTAQIISGASTSGSSGSDEETQKNTKKFSLGDIINFGKSAIRTVKDVTNVAKNTDWSLSNIGGIISTVENTIAGNQNGFDSISSLAQIAGGIMNGGGLSQIDVNSELKRGQETADRIQDLFSSKETKAENKSKREQGEQTNKFSSWLDNIGDKINGNSAEKINLSDEQKAVQDYINEQESAIEEDPLPGQ